MKFQEYFAKVGPQNIQKPKNKAKVIGHLRDHQDKQQIVIDEEKELKENSKRYFQKNVTIGLVSQALSKIYLLERHRYDEKRNEVAS